jgi:hypothetical protein
MGKIMKSLPLPDLHHLRAASGWLELGNHFAANEESEEIMPRLATPSGDCGYRYIQ